MMGEQLYVTLYYSDALNAWLVVLIQAANWYDAERTAKTTACPSGYVYKSHEYIDVGKLNIERSVQIALV
jgi:hypothetical protein